MKRTSNEASSENSDITSNDAQTKRPKAEDDSSNTANSVETPIRDPQIPHDGFAVPPQPTATTGTNDASSSVMMKYQLSPVPHLTQTIPPSLAELTLARANRHNALEAAQHQLATAVLRQSQVEDAYYQSRFHQQQAAIGELVRQQQQGGMLPNYGSPVLSPSSKQQPIGLMMGNSTTTANGGIMDASAAAAAAAASPYLNTATAPMVGAMDARMTLKDDFQQQSIPNGMAPNYGLFSNNNNNNSMMSPNNNNAATNFMSLTKEEQQGHLLALARSTQTGVSTSKKHGPYIPGIATRGEAFYDPGLIRELSLTSDRGNLSEYQCLLRKQIILFSVTINDIQCSAQGRNKPIVLGQVGVLCRHCAKIPPGMRPCGAAYFPAKLSGLYQASQNMAINHFTKSCRSIPEDIRESLIRLKAQKSTVLGGGKHFWANGAKILGVIEMDDGLLRFKNNNTMGGGGGDPTTAAAVAAVGGVEATV